MNQTLINELLSIGIKDLSESLNMLIDLTWKKDIESIISVLEQSSSKTNKRDGRLFEEYLGFLYHYSGENVTVTPPGHDGGIDIIIYDDSHNINRVISAKNWNKRLDKPNTLKEIKLFEDYEDNHKAPIPYKEVFSLAGFSSDAKKQERYRLKLKDKHDFTNLINKVETTPKTRPDIDLRPHNQQALKDSVEFLKNSHHVCITHATGTGKSYVIGSLIQNFEGRILLCAPSKFIFDQFEKSFPLLWNRIEPITYAKLANNVPKLSELSELSLIILDEFHRCGADKWGNGVQTLLKDYPDVPIFGTSATPVRHLDNNRDMADELFDGWVASNIPLPEAIQRRILPKPTYISALYELDTDIKMLQEQVHKSRKTETETKEMIGQLETIKINWRQSQGIATVLKKHLSSDVKKVIIFFDDREHMKSMRGKIIDWFYDGFEADVRDYTIYSNRKDGQNNKTILKEFRETKPKGSVYHVMFAIDMLNEGIHIGDVGAVILLRKTISPRIYYQQIGRCLQVDSKQNPMIFDLVNNCLSIKSTNFIEDCKKALDKENSSRKRDGLPPQKTNVTVHDDVKDVFERLAIFQESIKSWNVWYELLKQFQKEFHDRWPTSVEKYEGENLGRWCDTQRKAKKGQGSNKINSAQIKLLDDIGFSWGQYKQEKEEEKWHYMYDLLKKFRVDYPDRWPTSVEKYEGENLGSWLKSQRRNKERMSNKTKLHLEHIQLLDDIGFVWRINNKKWDENYDLLKQFKKEFPERWPTSYEKYKNENLGVWCAYQRKDKNNKILSDTEKKLLDDIGFPWGQKKEKDWHIWYNLLKQFRKEFPDRWPKQKEKYTNENLGVWCHSQRQAKKGDGKRKLTTERIKLLNNLGFPWKLK